VDNQDNDLRKFREDDFYKFIIPKVQTIKNIQLKREKFNLKMQDNCYYKILKEQDPNIVDLPIRDLHKLLKHRTQVQFSMKVKIIELRFGKYGNLRPMRLSITNIAKRVSIARSTVYKIIQKYVDNEGMISAIPEK
jgi:predicted transcriptional regulator